MNLRARRHEEGIASPEEERPDRWVGWPALVRRVGAWFCGLILFSFALGILGLSLRTGLLVAGVSLGAFYLASRTRRGKP
jgi:hypothetical protein